MTGADNPPGAYASSPCFAHELTLTEGGYVTGDAQAAADVARWRKAERKRLIDLRAATPVGERRRIALEVAAALDRLLEPGAGLVISVYWPIRGELDLRDWMRAAHAAGARIALPVVRERARPLEFRAWTPEGRMARGVWNILEPADGPAVTPDVTIAPLVGVDRHGYRLGYGGGYFDRTLAAAAPRPMAVGVGLPCAEIRSIYPQPHDIPMDVTVTGAERVLRRQGA